MPAPPVFWRSPRLNPPLPEEEIEIPSPPSKPSPPSPMLPMIMSAGLMAVVMLGIGLGTGRTSLMMFSVPMILASGLAAIGANQYQKREYKKQLKERDAGYKGLLLSYEKQLQGLIEQQYSLLLKKDPEPKVCLEWVEKLHRNVWVRKPDNTDFLEVRLGLGERPSTVTVVAPRTDNPISPDPLVQQAQGLAEQFKFVKNAPISLPIREAGVIGIASQAREKALNMVRAILVQIATHHGPDNVKISAIFHPQEEREWAWLRWLPHTWNNEFTFRYLADSKSGVHRLLLRLNDELNQRQNRRKMQSIEDEQHSSFSSYYICVIASPQLTDDEPVIQRLQTEGPEFGFYPIFLNTEVKRLPQYCQAIIKVVAGQATLAFLEPTITRYPYIPDKCSPKLVWRFSNIMAPLRLESTATLRLPDAVSLLEMLNVKKVDDIPVYQQWQARIEGNEENKGVLKSIAAPIGWGVGNETLILDLHEKAHGPNGLIAGMVGAGKSILLQSLIVSLATNYHPDQVAFVLIDYKGGGMAEPFKDLPHTLGILDNLQEGNFTRRALNSFDTETKRRLGLFKKVGVNHIDQYHKIYYSQTDSDGEKLPPLPYLVIIVDEFAEMKTERPDEAKEFVSIARLGRALGYRMILAMQKPEGIVDGQIEANTRFRLCLRVAQPSDSKAMLKRPDAAFLSHSGRAYFQVGVNEIFEQFQVAYGEQAYDPDGVTSNDPNEIFHVKLDGRRISLFSPRANVGKRSLSAEKQITQLSALIKHIETEARQHGVSRGEPLWLPVLPSKILLKDLLPSVAQWNGTQWAQSNQPIAPIVGKIDIPAKKAQPELKLNFESGNYLIFGASGSGKTTFLKTLIMSLALTYSPADVNIYVLDFGGQGLSIFDPYPVGGTDREPSLPHIGDVIPPDEPERVIRLLNILRKEMIERGKLFSKVSAENLSSYCSKSKKQLPAIVVIIDNYVKFADLFEDQQGLLKEIIREGSSKGIYVVITANNTSDIHAKVRELFDQIITFNLTKNDYGDALGERPTIQLESKPGRGFIKNKPPLEFQTALPEEGDGDVARNEHLKTRIQDISHNWHGVVAKPIPVLDDVILLRKLLDLQTDLISAHGKKLWAPIGRNVADLDVFVLNIQNKPICLVVGGARSGKTMLLATIATALGFRYSPDELTLFVFDSGKQELLFLNELPHIARSGGYSYQPESGPHSLMSKIIQEVERRQGELNKWRQKRLKNIKYSKPEFSPMLIIADDVFDSVYDGTSGDDKNYMAKIARMGHELNISLIISGTLGVFGVGASYNHALVAATKRGQNIILGSNDVSLMNNVVSNIKLSNTDRQTQMTTGEGFWVSEGQYQKIKFAVLGQKDTENNLIESIKQRYPLASDKKNTLPASDNGAQPATTEA